MLLILQLLLDSGQQLVSGQSTGVINNGDGAVSVQGNNRRSGHGRSGRSHAGGGNSIFSNTCAIWLMTAAMGASKSGML